MARLSPFLATCLACFAYIGLAAAASSVLDLIPSNFDSVVLKSNRPAFVEFFAPWCGHCKTLAPVYEELAQRFDFASDRVAIAKVDADSEKSLGRRFGVQGFPTLKWFDGKSDSPEDYKGGRDVESLTKFVTDKTGLRSKIRKSPPSAVQILTDLNFTQVTGSEKNVLVAFTAPWCGHCKSLAPTWESMAETFSQDDSLVVVAKVDAESDGSKVTATREGITSYPTIKYFASKSSKGELYDKSRSPADLVAFINEKSGTHRLLGGSLNANAGTVDLLDAIIAKTSNWQAASALDTITKAAEGLSNKYASYYTKVASKMRTSQDYAAWESNRLEGILKRGGLAAMKVDDVTSRMNILRKFIRASEEKDEL